MKRFAKRLSVVFFGGCLGGLANSLTVWLCGAYGLTTQLGVRISPSLTPNWLYPRLVWGGIWGFVFLLPILRNTVLGRGLLISMGPTVIQLFVVFPHQTPHGVMGMGLGTLTPFFVLVFNAVWGIITALWLRYMGE